MVFLSRKIVTASITTIITSLLIGLLFPTPFGKLYSDGYIVDVLTSTLTYMMYVLPAVYIYGILVSIISDKIGGFLGGKTKDSRVEFIISASLHMLFGAILILYSLIGAISFFVVDRMLLTSNYRFTWVTALLSIFLPLVTLIILIYIVG